MRENVKKYFGDNNYPLANVSIIPDIEAVGAIFYRLHFFLGVGALFDSM